MHLSILSFLMDRLFVSYVGSLCKASCTQMINDVAAENRIFAPASSWIWPLTKDNPNRKKVTYIRNTQHETYDAKMSSKLYMLEIA